MMNLFFIGAVALVLILGGAGCKSAETRPTPATVPTADTVEITLPPITNPEPDTTIEVTTKPAAPVVQAKPVATKAELATSWLVVSGSDFEEITLHPDGTFSTFLYQNPFVDGTWMLSGNSFTLNASAGPELSATYVVETLLNGTLTLRDSDGQIVWKKL